MNFYDIFRQQAHKCKFLLKRSKGRHWDQISDKGKTFDTSNISKSHSIMIVFRSVTFGELSWLFTEKNV